MSQSCPELDHPEVVSGLSVSKLCPDFDQPRAVSGSILAKIESFDRTLRLFQNTIHEWKISVKGNMADPLLHSRYVEMV